MRIADPLLGDDPFLSLLSYYPIGIEKRICYLGLCYRESVPFEYLEFRFRVLGIDDIHRLGFTSPSAPQVPW